MGQTRQLLQFRLAADLRTDRPQASLIGILQIYVCVFRMAVPPTLWRLTRVGYQFNIKLVPNWRQKDFLFFSKHEVFCLL